MSASGQLDIELAGGVTISVDAEENGDVILIVDPNAVAVDPVVLSLSPAVAAYLAGQIAGRAGVHLA